MGSSSHIFTRLGFKGVTSLKCPNKKIYSVNKSNFPKMDVSLLFPKYSDIGSIEDFDLDLNSLFNDLNMDKVEYVQI